MINQLAKKIFFGLAPYLLTITSFAQENFKDFLLQLPKSDLPVYQIDNTQEGYFKVKMTFEDFEVQNSQELELLSSKEIIAIDLVYTLFPENKDFTDLNTNRIKALDQIFPALTAKKNILWRYIGQSACKTREEAKHFFHGFVIYYRNFSPMQKIHFPEELFIQTYQNMAQVDFKDSTVLYKLYRNNHVSEDSTVYKVLQRKSHLWEKTLTVIDWTGSMYPFGFQVLTWLKLNQKNADKFVGLVFFNDGDDKLPGEKIIGSTGGIYHTASLDWIDIIHTMIRAQNAGQGGYNDENDLEALIYGQRFYLGCKNIILIADSQSFVRDMVLLNYFAKKCQENEQTLHIILCGVKEKVVSDYVYMAAVCRGSIHTISQDIEDLSLNEDGRVINQEGKFYTFRNGSFELLNPKRRRKNRISPHE